MKVINCKKAKNPVAFAVSFVGRPNNCPVGSGLRISCTVYADDIDSARIAIYQEYEHLHSVEIAPIEGVDHD